MVWCINLHCLERQNLNTEERCVTCGTTLLIQDRYQLIRPLRSLKVIGYTEIF